MATDVAEVIANTTADRAKFEAFCRSLTAAELEAPIPASHWRVKEYMSHLATIDIWVGEWFAAWATGTKFTFTNPDGSAFNIDAWNEEQVTRLRDGSVEAILGEAAGHRARLFATMETFTRPVLDQPFDFRGNRITFLRYLQLWTGHDAAHTWDMLKALPARQSEPALTAWLAQYKLTS